MISKKILFHIIRLIVLTFCFLEILNTNSNLFVNNVDIVLNSSNTQMLENEVTVQTSNGVEPLYIDYLPSDHNQHNYDNASFYFIYPYLHISFSDNFRLQIEPLYFSKIKNVSKHSLYSGLPTSIKQLILPGPEMLNELQVLGRHT